MGIEELKRTTLEKNTTDIEHNFKNWFKDQSNQTKTADDFVHSCNAPENSEERFVAKVRRMKKTGLSE
jgi:type IV secretory pathway VirB4 component